MNWHERIEAAEKRGGFTKEDKLLARDWVTCACGEQDPRIPRGLGSRPRDFDLQYFGGLFSSDVSRDNFEIARQTLERIETRAKEILHELA